MEALTIQNLHKKYGKTVVLNNLNLSITTCDIVAMVGVNGAGKSTLLEIVCGVKKQSDGNITILGLSSSEQPNKKAIKQQIGYMPQHFSLFQDLTVKQNLQYMASVYQLSDGSVIEQLLSECYLSEKQHFLAKNLSGGYKQLLSLAAALIHKPKLLILDEPTSAMDPLFRAKFWHIIKQRNAVLGTTVLVTTHYMEEIFECNKALFLSEGKVIHAADVCNLFENGRFASVNEVLNFYILKEHCDA